MFARDAAQCAAARAVQTDPDNGLLALVKARPRIDDPLTGKDQVLFQQRRRSAPLRKEFIARGHGVIQVWKTRRVRVGKARFERCGASNNILCLGGILHARQFNDDAIRPLLLHERLGNAQFVHALGQGKNVLLQRIFLHRGARFGRKRAGQRNALIRIRLCYLPLQFTDVAGKRSARFFRGIPVCERNHNLLINAADAAAADGAFAQQRARFASASSFLASAPAISTCNWKCTPPRKSRPKYMGRAYSALSQAGEALCRLSATIYAGSEASGFRLFDSSSLTRNWVSVSASRTHRLGFGLRRSKVRPRVWMRFKASVCSTF